MHRKTIHASFPLADMEIKKTVPKCGQFNLIGASWGAIIAARSAVYYADNGMTVHNLVLIGAPINMSLLKSVYSNKRIKNIIVINQDGDPIFAGISDDLIIRAVPTIVKQMREGKGYGHFHYADGPHGKDRREALAKRLYREGLR